MCAPSNETILNEKPLYLGPLLYFAHPEPGALWQGLGRCFFLQFNPVYTIQKCTSAVLQDYLNYLFKFNHSYCPVIQRRVFEFNHSLNLKTKIQKYSLDTQNYLL